MGVDADRRSLEWNCQPGCVAEVKRLNYQARVFGLEAIFLVVFDFFLWGGGWGLLLWGFFLAEAIIIKHCLLEGFPDLPLLFALVAAPHLNYSANVLLQYGGFLSS